ncbi:hypothetical protein HZA97_06095 [Candidatus Woesearchaeota archaeon]|nr:hypothetical protein [Candidatus Woesearchaeota archaeon]
MEEKKLNQKQRMQFVEQWANYVKENTDWSRQQAKLINSMLKNSKNSSLSKEDYLELKEKSEKC